MQPIEDNKKNEQKAERPPREQCRTPTPGTTNPTAQAGERGPRNIGLRRDYQRNIHQTSPIPQGTGLPRPSRVNGHPLSLTIIPR